MEAKRYLNYAVATGAMLMLAWAGASVGAAFQMKLTPSATVNASTPPFGPSGGGAQADEIDDSMVGDDADSGGIDADAGGFDVDSLKSTFGGVNRSIAKGAGAGQSTTSRAKAKSNPELVRSFEGLNFNQQRFANSGNQLSVAPPSPNLCVGNGFVMETVNDVIKIYDTAGNLLKGPIDQNTFHGYLPAINRQAAGLPRGPSITDPSCLYDAETGRFFHVVLTLDHVGTTTSNAGTNHLDIAVSNTSDPTGAWTIYQLPVQNNGTQGTPNHNCNNGFCLGDYPHIGADANGFYITTNEFAFFGPGFFYGVNIYALDKHALASHAASVNAVLLFQNVDDVPAFTVWPAQSPGTQFNTDNGGTEFLLSSLALFTDDGTSNQLVVWSITNTQSLATASPSLSVNIGVLGTLTYSIPPRSNQKPGNTPLRDCVADTTTNCFALIAGASSRFNNVLATPDSNDSRMQQVSYANGKLWGALDTGVNISGDVNSDHQQITRAGIAYFVFNPNSGVIFQQGIVALKGNNLTYPAIGVTPSGRGVMAFTLLGNDHHPSAAYTPIDAKVGAGDIHIIAEGAGPQDGFSGYKPLVSSIRPRWGDYGAAAVDGNTIWIASEYIAQTCNYAAYFIDPTCGGARGALGNWSTRITQLSTK
jgi:hypothetical protein